MSDYKLHLVTNNAYNTLIVSYRGQLRGILPDSETQQGALSLYAQLQAGDYGDYSDLDDWCGDINLTQDQIDLLRINADGLAFHENDPRWLEVAIKCYGEECDADVIARMAEDIKAN